MASTTPSRQTVQERSVTWIVSPSATNMTISARLASDVKNDSISSLYGVRSSPTRMPATKTARKPEPCSVEARP